MANEEHVELLQRGVADWNLWRRENPSICPDLSGVSLRGKNLSGAFLRGVDLSACDLLCANLSKVDLREALLMAAYLRGADLTEADLSGSYLVRTDLREARMNAVRLWDTIFAGTDLENAIGLDCCRHSGPSFIDYRTLLRSGPLPIAFLRGCGLTDRQLNCYQAKSNQDDYFSCFISYSSKDEEFAVKLHDDLQRAGIRCWFAPKDISPGKKLYDQLSKAIKEHEKLLLILSENSMSSTWVSTEIRKARRQECELDRQILFPIRLTNFEQVRKWELFDSNEGRDLADEVRSYFMLDFSDWNDESAYRDSFRRLLNGLKIPFR